MSEDQVEDLLVEWELARREGREIETHVLCKDFPELTEIVQQHIQVLKKSSWMLNDPAPTPHSEEIVQSLSRLTYNEESDSETLLSSLLETSAFAATDIHDASTKSAGEVGHYEIPGFKIEQELGRGGFGVVYRAYDEALLRSVAIKIPLLNDAKSRSRYLTEARNAAKVEVAGIVPVLQVGSTNEGIPFVVQKLIDGKSLAQILKAGAQMSPRQVAVMLIEVCHALGAAHAESLIHRDLKPGNIMVDKKGKPWVTDFGLAITEDEQFQRRGEIAGTPSYMSPEQLEGKVDWCDGRTDIWAIGVILYQCLTGRMPFRGQNRAELKDQILNMEPRPICQRDPHLAKEWDIIFARCCSKSMNDRYHSAFDLAIDLGRVPLPEVESSEIQSLPISHQSFANSGVSGSYNSTDSHSQANESKNWLAIVSVTALCVIALATFGILWNNSQPNSSTSSNDAATQSLMELVVGGSSEQPNQFADLQSAINAAAPDAEIKVEPGTYRGNFKVAKTLTISSADGGNGYTLLGTNGSALMVSSKGDLKLVGAKLITESTEPVNTIEVTGGKLRLENCELEANGYNSLMVEADSEVKVEECEFLVTDDHAIVAEDAKLLEVMDSTFDLSLNAEKSLAGIQVLESRCKIVDCEFKGSSNNDTGVYLKNVELESAIEDCQFSNLGQGIMLVDCYSIRIGGSESTFTDCHKSIDLKASQAAIRNCNIKSADAESSVGIQVHEFAHSESQTDSTISQCKIQSAETGLLVIQAKVTATNLTIKECSVAGLRVLDNAELEWSFGSIANNRAFGAMLRSGKATFERVDILDNSLIGLLVDSGNDAVKLNSSTIKGNPVGVIVASGSCRLESTEIIESETGVLMARKHQLYQEPTGDSPLRLITDSNSFINADKAVINFLSPGTMQLNGCRLNGGPNNEATWAGNLEHQEMDSGEIRVFESTGPKI